MNMQEIENYIDGIATGKPQRINGPTIKDKLDRLADMQAQVDAIQSALRRSKGFAPHSREP